MELDLTEEEKKLVEYSQEAIVKYNKIRHANDGIDTLYAFVLSDKGNIYDGASYEPKEGLWDHWHLSNFVRRTVAPLSMHLRPGILRRFQAFSTPKQNPAPTESTSACQSVPVRVHFPPGVLRNANANRWIFEVQRRAQ